MILTIVLFLSAVSCSLSRTPGGAKITPFIAYSTKEGGWKNISVNDPKLAQLTASAVFERNKRCKCLYNAMPLELLGAQQHSEMKLNYKLNVKVVDSTCNTTTDLATVELGRMLKPIQIEQCRPRKDATPVNECYKIYVPPTGSGISFDHCTWQ